MIYSLNTFCIYNKDEACICSDIHLDISGHCEGRILIDLDEDFLQERKQIILDSYAEDDYKYK